MTLLRKKTLFLAFLGGALLPTKTAYPVVPFEHAERRKQVRRHIDLEKTLFNKLDSERLKALYRAKLENGKSSPLAKFVGNLFKIIEGDEVALVPTRNKHFLAYHLSDKGIGSFVGQMLNFILIGDSFEQESTSKSRPKRLKDKSMPEGPLELLKYHLEQGMLNDVREDFCTDLQNKFKDPKFKEKLKGTEFEEKYEKNTRECLKLDDLTKILWEMREKDVGQDFINTYNAADFVETVFKLMPSSLGRTKSVSDDRNDAILPLSVLCTYALARSLDPDVTTKILRNKVYEFSLLRDVVGGYNADDKVDLKNSLVQSLGPILKYYRSPEAALHMIRRLFESTLPKLFNMVEVPGEPTDCCEASFFNVVALFEVAPESDLIRSQPQRWQNPSDLVIRRKIKRMSSGIDSLSYYEDDQTDLKPSVDNFLGLLEHLYDIDAEANPNRSRLGRLNALCSSLLFNNEPVQCDVTTLDSNARVAEPEDVSEPWTNVIIRFSSNSYKSIFDIKIYENVDRIGRPVGHCVARSEYNKNLLMTPAFSPLRELGVNEDNVHSLPDLFPFL